MTAHDSAAKEAFEEAGVRGSIDAEPLGSYDYQKWGGTCTVTVFGLAVNDCLPDGEWEESHRMRLWLDPDKAAKRVDEPGLRAILETLATRLGQG